MTDNVERTLDLVSDFLHEVMETPGLQEELVKNYRAVKPYVDLIEDPLVKAAFKRRAWRKKE